MKRKKKRSAKQLANDKRLGRMAKARAKAKRGGRRKVAKKKNPCNYGRKKTTRKKTTRKNPHTYRKSAGTGTRPKLTVFNIFKCYGKSVRFLGLTAGGKLQWTIRDASISWRSQKKAAGIATKLSKRRGMSQYQLGVAANDFTATQIAAECKKGKA